MDKGHGESRLNEGIREILRERVVGYNEGREHDMKDTERKKVTEIPENDDVSDALEKRRGRKAAKDVLEPHVLIGLLQGEILCE